MASFVAGVAAAPVAQAAVAAYPTRIVSHARVVAMVLGPDGRHHILSTHTGFTGLVYSVEKDGRWQSHELPGDLTSQGDIALAPDGTPVVALPGATVGQNLGPVRLGTFSTGAWTLEDVAPGTSSDTLERLRLAIGTDGVIHVAYSGDDGLIKYRTKSADVWSDLEIVFPSELPTMFFATWDMVLDSTDVPHFVVAGHSSATTPGAPCDPDGGCVVDLVPDGSDWAVTPLSSAGGFPEAIHTPAGGLEVALNDDFNIRYVGSASGSLATELVFSGNAPFSSISRSTAGPVIFYGAPTGVRRADRGPSAWTTSTLTSGSLPVVGSVDALDRPHVAYVIPYMDPQLGSTSDVYLYAPDDVAPTVGIPGVRPRSKSTISSTIPMTVSWSAADAQSGISHFRVHQKTDTGGWTTVATTLTGTSVTRNLATGHTYAFRVIGYDKAGRVSSWKTGLPFRISRFSEASSLIRYSGTWASSTSSTADGGKTRYTTSSVGRATITFTGTAFAWVSPMSSTRGRADVYVDGVFVAEVNTYRSTAASRVVVFSTRWATSGTHTVQIRNTPVGSRKRIDIDSILIVR